MVLFEDVDFDRYYLLDVHHVEKHFPRIITIISKSIHPIKTIEIFLFSLTLYSAISKVCLFFFRLEYVDRKRLASIRVLP